MTDNLKVQVWREGYRFVARCLEFDVVSEGENREDALQNLRRGLSVYLDRPAASMDAVPYKGVGP